MQALREDAVRDTDAWLSNVVTGLVGSTDVIRADSEELWTLLDTLPVAILISTDQNCSRMLGNRAAQAMLRVPLGSNFSQTAPAAELPDFEVYSEGRLVDPDDLPMQRAARTGRRVERSECEIRFKRGNTVFIAGHCIPLKDATGAVCGSMGAFVDVTERRRAQDSTALVAKEMAHRLRNTVSLIHSLAHATIRKELAPSAYQVFEQRLLNLAHTQDLIGKSGSPTPMLNELLSTTVSGIAQDKSSQVKLAGPSLEISADIALPLSMVFHELATNAYKYGALKNGGTVAISWSEQAGVLTLVWRESGHLHATPGEPGFGSELIDRIVGSLPRGQFARVYDHLGVTATLQFAR